MEVFIAILVIFLFLCFILRGSKEINLVQKTKNEIVNYVKKDECPKCHSLSDFKVETIIVPAHEYFLAFESMFVWVEEERYIKMTCKQCSFTYKFEN